MLYADEEIRLAKLFRDQGLAWEPRAGHYVYDDTGFCKQASPFQEKVYFILNYEYFMKKVGGVERFKEIMIWLPTWHDAREILRGLGVTGEKIAHRLGETQAIQLGTERLVMYELIASELASDFGAA